MNTSSQMWGGRGFLGRAMPTQPNVTCKPSFTQVCHCLQAVSPVLCRFLFMLPAEGQSLLLDLLRRIIFVSFVSHGIPLGIQPPHYSSLADFLLQFGRQCRMNHLAINIMACWPEPFELFHDGNIFLSTGCHLPSLAASLLFLILTTTSKDINTCSLSSGEAFVFF